MARKNTRTIKGGDRAINRLIRLSVETGCLTAASAIIELGFFLGPTTKNTNLHLFLYVPHPQHYTTSGNTNVLTQAPIARLNVQCSHSGQEYVPLELFCASRQTLTPHWLSPVYSNMMMTSLNSRAGPQQMGTAPSTTDSMSRSVATTRNLHAGGTISNCTDASPVVHITSHTEIFADDLSSTSNREDKLVWTWSALSSPCVPQKLISFVLIDCPRRH